ncbi:MULTISPECIES: hypothetical protein [unclassified Bartonella]
MAIKSASNNKTMGTVCAGWKRCKRRGAIGPTQIAPALITGA